MNWQPQDSWRPQPARSVAMSSGPPTESSIWVPVRTNASSPGVDDGFSLDFGHDDLIAGRASRAEVLPRILEWIDEHGH